MFRTEITIPPADFSISHHSKLLTVGSCFSDCMGLRFTDNKFNVLANPFGTVYNPLSIANLLNYSTRKLYPEAHTYVQSGEFWTNLDFHSTFSHSDRTIVEKNIRQTIDQTSEFLKKTNVLIVTLGTAFVYERVDNGYIVANCHKLPAHHFNKRLLTTQKCISGLEPALHKLINEIEGLHVILTVSPVRHIKDTIERNSLSKSILRVVCDELASRHEQISYFLSYEIMMDDLRDYRFYKADMIHPTDVAEDYIWKKFANVYFDDETKGLIREWSKIRTAIEHRPFNPASSSHQQFVSQTIDRIRQLEKYIDVEKELEYMTKQLSK